MKHLVCTIALVSAVSSPFLFSEDLPSLHSDPARVISADASSAALPVSPEDLWSATDSFNLASIATLAQAESVATDASSSLVSEPVTGAETSAPVAETAAPAVAQPVVPASLLDNEFYRESLRLKQLSETSFEYGDYDAAATYAADSAAQAVKSDEYVTLKLKENATDKAILTASTRLSWARSIGAEKTWAEPFNAAQAAYDRAVSERTSGNLDSALASANAAINLLANVREVVPLPARYKVRTWAEARDCFWNIAGYSFVYGDSRKWQVLYKANRAKLRRPENPDLLNPGIVLTIPSIRGEYRSGDWNKGTAYEPLKK